METCETVQFYLKHLEYSSYPVMTEEQFAVKLFPVYRYFVTVWLRHSSPEVKLGVIKSLKPMLNLLLPNEDLREQVYDYIPLLLAEYQSSLEPLFITQLCGKGPAPHQYNNQNLAETVQCFMALARSYPKELMKFFSQMETGKETPCVATLSLIKALENHRENFYQKNLEEKLVHKVTMDTMRIITSSVSGMTNPQEFWMRLLSCIMETDCMEALTPICVSLMNLARCQFHDIDQEAVDLPAPQKLLARLLVLVSLPYKGEGRGIAILNLLRTLSHSIVHTLANMWQQEVPLLVQYLEEHTEFTWNQKAWEDKLIQGFLYRALGFTLAMGLEADKVQLLLLELLYKTDYGNDFNREGVIQCFGLCARGQVKMVLNVLRDFEERIQESEHTWQISAWQKDLPWQREAIKSTHMMMYSCVSSSCHPQMLLAYVDSPTMAKIIHHYSSSCQDIGLKMAFMKSVVQVTGAIRNIQDPGDFQFAPKLTLTSLKTAIIQADLTDHLASPVRALAIDALSHLSKLRPFYSTEESSELMEISIHSVVSLQPPGEDNESIKSLYANALRSLERLMESLLQRQLDPKGLQEMVHLLEKWILSGKDWEREKAMNLHLHLMEIYIRSVGFCIPLKLGQFGTLVGLIAPCTCDAHPGTCMASTNVLSSLLDLHGAKAVADLARAKVWVVQEVFRQMCTAEKAHWEQGDQAVEEQMLEGDWSACRARAASLQEVAQTKPCILLITSESVFPTASQTCSLWDAAKEMELQRCREDLLSMDEGKISCASSRIAKVVCRECSCDEVASLIQKLCENIGAMDLQRDKAAVTWIGTFLQMRVKELDDKVAELHRAP
ncbi:HEAT repeat-containing protein 7B1 [Fukomys damarensis]|uniref:HEAT repeat-containing protein 7B1 n=1 Tax=Fukomys damarensis TaxID=885580 RepID=A0A091DPN1_FUKDA|nr:HEAT repeat-containing protein 7B1 [Fukomys damarensis]